MFWNSWKAWPFRAHAGMLPSFIRTCPVWILKLSNPLAISGRDMKIRLCLPQGIITSL